MQIEYKFIKHHRKSRLRDFLFDYGDSLMNTHANSQGLVRDSLSNQIADRLIREINQGVYLPDGLLPSESEFSRMFDVSRSVIREALTILSAQGYIEIKNGKRARVLDVNDEPLRVFFSRILNTHPESLLDLLEIRKVLEGKSAEYAAKRATEADIQRLREVISEMNNYIDDPKYYPNWDIRFHIELARCSQNLYLYHLVNSIRHMLVKIVNELQTMPFQVTPSKSLQLHKDVFDAVVMGDAEGARLAMDRHFENVINRIIKVQQAKSSEQRVNAESKTSSPPISL